MLVVFTLGASAQVRRRRLLPVSLAGSERRLRQECLQATVETGREAGLVVALASPQELPASGPSLWLPQAEGTFGERLGRALEASFAQGAGPVVVVGDDSPGLRVRHLQAALRLLDGHEGRVVLGPARDGGVYLIAAARTFGTALEGVAWCSSLTRETLVSALRRAGREVVFLDSLTDLDSTRDLEGWLASGPCLPRALRLLALGLRRVLAALRRPVLDIAPLYLDLLRVAPCPGRAPPRPAFH
jgi:glycosyltransferase A (GT-A) superfamily protein (DUF2064 family)